MTRCGRLLYNALSPEYGIHVNLISLAGLYSEPMSLLVDVPSFLRYLYSRYTSAVPDEDLFLDEGPLMRYEFAEYWKLRAMVIFIIIVLRQKNIELEFIDGASSVLDISIRHHNAIKYSTTYYRRIARLETQLTSRKIIPVCRCFGVWSHGVPLPPLAVAQIYSALETVGSRLWVVPDNIEIWMHKMALERSTEQMSSRSLFPTLPRIFALLSDNIEFSLITGLCRMIPMSMFDPTGRLPWFFRRIVADSPEFIFQSSTVFPTYQLRKLSALDVYIFGPEQLSTLVGIPVSRLHDAMILLGNQFTSFFYDKFPSRFAKLPYPKSLGDFSKVSATLLDAYESLEAVPMVQAAIKVIPHFNQAIQLSRIFYGDETTGIELADLLVGHPTHLVGYRLCQNYLARPLPASTTFISFLMDLPVGWPESRKDVLAVITFLTETRCVPFWLQRAFVDQVYYRPPHIEYTTLISSCIEDVLLEFRRWCYGVVCEPDAVIVEYGRVHARFDAQISVLPHALPDELTFKTLLLSHASRHWTQKDGLEATSRFVVSFIVSDPCNAELIFEQPASLLELYFKLLEALRYPFPTETHCSRCFLQHELETLLVSILATASRCRRWMDVRLPELSEAREEVEQLYASMRDSGVELPSDDPLNLCDDTSKQHCKYINRVGLHGLVPGFRATVVFGWFQMVWSYLLDVYTLFSFAPIGDVEDLGLSPSLLFNGDIFRWFYAAGAYEWWELGAENPGNVPRALDGLPTNIHSFVRRQSKCVRLMRTGLLKASALGRRLFYGPRDSLHVS